MTQDQIEKKLIEIVCHIQKISGREEVPVTYDTKPVKDVPGFDSLNGVETTVEVVEFMKDELPFNNVFVDDHDGKALTVRQASARLFACLSAKK